MAGLMTTTNQADFIPEIVAQEAFGRLRQDLFLVQNVTKDSEIEGQFTKGKVLNIGFTGALTAQEKTETGDIVIQNPDSDVTTVTLDHHYHVAMSPSSFLRAVANVNIEDAYQEDAFSVLAEEVEQSILNLAASTTYSKGSAGVDVDESLILDVREQMHTNKAPKRGRFAVFESKDEKALLKIDRFTSAEKIGDPTKIANGAVGRVHGFDTFQSNLTYTSGAAPASTHGLAWSRGGIILASRPLPPINSAKSSVQMVDPYSGLIFRITLGYSDSKNEDQVIVDALWGVAILRQALVCRILT